VNTYSKDFYDRIQSKLNVKADTDLFSKFSNNVEEKVLSELNRKIDKIELRRAHNSIRRKLDRLEDKVGDLKAPSKGSLNCGPVALSNNNKKCISCFRDVSEDLYQLSMN
jgi:hypothetical protein